MKALDFLKPGKDAEKAATAASILPYCAKLYHIRIRVGISAFVMCIDLFPVLSFENSMLGK